MSDSPHTNRVSTGFTSMRAGSPKKQAGLSFIGVFALIGVGMFLGLFAFKVGPNYFEYMTVKNIADEVQANTELLRSPKSKVMAHIGRAYRTNNLWDLKPEETITLQKDGKRGYQVTVSYEKRANLFSNIDVVTAFNAQAGNN